ncbi:hypothetical protein [Kitasatospora sp. NPDC101183]|uniref:hypothetical protein n=1 Tax=Kitasatospora sp. NPDC101183 TaxID=3364100 RepID=UPI00380EFFCF
MRPRLRYTTYPRPSIRLTDTPNPKCPSCQGAGGWDQDYGDENGEYGGTETYYCLCWNPDRSRNLLPVPHWIARRWLGWTEPVYSSEPPF